MRRYKKFAGLTEKPSGRIMIGHLMIVSGPGDICYSLAYAGIWNYSDIQVEAKQILVSFLDRNLF
jgi:hypothetical protein